MSQCTLDSLPYELTKKIIEHVLPEYQSSRISTLAKTVLVNKAWFSVSIPILWKNIFECGFKLSTMEILLRSLPTVTKQSLGIHELLPREKLLMPYGQFVSTILLEKLFYYIDTWLGQKLPNGNSNEKRRSIACELLQCMHKRLEKLVISGFHINKMWAENYEVILHSRNLIENLQVFVIRAAFNSTNLVSGLADTCTKLTELEFDYFSFDEAPLPEEIEAALKLIIVQGQLRSLTWSSVFSIDPARLISALSHVSETLVHLRIERSNFKKVLSLENISRCANLKTLTFKDCENVSEQAVFTMTQWPLNMLNSIELLSCRNFEPMTDFARLKGVLQEDTSTPDFFVNYA